MTQEKSVSLYFREGGSDKVYQAQLRERPDGWAVTFQYGRRGKALTEGEKGNGLTHEKALSVYDKLVQSKISKGYTESETGIAYSSQAMSGRATGFVPQLLNEIPHEEAMLLGADWLVQEKHDGERLAMIHADGETLFANRKGLATGASDPIVRAFARICEINGGELLLDAEDMGDHAVIFDVPKHFMIREGTFRERAAILDKLQKDILHHGLGEALIVDVPTPAPHFFGHQEARLRAGNAEGYVLRHADSLYRPGRPNSGGEALKVKYWEDVTCRVTAGREGKSSVGLELLDDGGRWTAVGNVTIPSGRDLPQPGSLIDVKYLYAHAGGSLFQPSFKGLRTDVAEAECRMSRLKFKAEPAMEDPTP